MKLKNIRILLLIILSASCSSRETTTIGSMPVASVTVVIPSLAPTLRSTKTPTSTATPTSTFLPIETISVATLNAVSTLDAIRLDLINKFPELQEYSTSCFVTSCYGVEASPNGRWMIFTNGNTIELYRADGEKVGKYSFYDIYGFLIGFYEGYVEAVHWAKDGRYLYISATPGGDGGPEPYFRYRSALVRVNLENGTWRDVNVSGSFEFSPNDKFIIYSNSKGRVNLRDIQTGMERAYFAPEKYFYFGEYVWASGGEKVIFVASPESWESEDSTFGLLMIDVESGVLLDLYESLFPFYYPISWEEEDKVTLNKFQEYGEWVLHLSTTQPTISP